MNIKKHNCLIGFIIGLILSVACPCEAANTDKPLVIRGSNNYPPFEFLNENGQPDGFNVDLLRAVMQELNLTYDLKLEDWSKVTTDIQNKDIDAAIGMIYSKDRAQNVRFTLPTCVISRNFITRKNDHIRFINDLKGKEIIVEKGGWFHQYLQENGLAGRIIESEDIYQSLKLLEEGKHDAVLASDLVAQYAIKKMKIKDLFIGDLGISPQNYGMVVNHDNDELLYRFNIGLQRLKISGVYDQIYNKWFGIYESRNYRKALFIALGIFVFIASLLVLFVWLLRKQVGKATRMLHYSKQEVGIAIDAGKISAWTYTVKDRFIQSLHGESLGGKGCTIEKVYETIHPDDHKKVKKEFEALACGAKTQTAVSFRIHKNKQDPHRYVETKMVRAEATKELPLRIVGTLKDITEDVLMRQKLDEYMLKSEFIIHTNGIILIQYDLQKKTFFRISDHTTAGNSSYTIEQYLSMIYPEDIPTASQFIDNLNQASQVKLETEFRIIGEDGAYHWFVITAVAYKYDETGKITSYMGLRQDNSKWKKMNNDLVVLREKAEASNRLKSAFLANMSHEIRTPLNAIVGFSELITDATNQEEKEQFIEIVKKNNELLLQLINDVLDLSRIEAGYTNFNLAGFNFSQHFHELYLSLKLKETRDIKLTCINPCDELIICSDANRISQVITNFVTNAFKFTTEGSITLSYQFENDGLKICVTDTGIGIDHENQSRIFERFEKLNDFAQGTGLGLPICKVIIEALQGKIGVESQKGIGSTFWFWIPCQPKNTKVQLLQPQSGMALSNKSNLSSSDLPRANNKKKTVLIAEDIENNYIIISTIIKDNYHIIRAKNGIEAIEMTKQDKPDIVLMDMKMPLMNGIEATKEIRKFDPDVPIIALTAYVFDTNKEDALGAGCNDFLSKPVNKQILMEALNHCN